MTRSISTIQEPLPHASLGLPAYVQISSPIRRYTDLLAHWQIKVRTPLQICFSQQQKNTESQCVGIQSWERGVPRGK